MIARPVLLAADESALVLRGATAVTRADALAQAGGVVKTLHDSGAQAALVASDDPADILAAIEACAQTGADLFVAHTSLPDTEIDHIVEAYGVGLVLRPGAVEPVASAAPRPAEGRIFMMTSGTTGRPKIAAHRLDTLLARARPRHLADGRWLLTYQPTGFAGLQVSLTAAATGGAVIAPEKRSPAGFLEAAHRHGATHISGTPTFWRSFLMAGRVDLALEQATMGGEGVDQATLDRVKAAFPGVRLTHTYASTEAGMVFAVHDGLEGFPRAWLDAPQQGVELRLRDGFLHVKSPHAMRFYLNQPEQPLLEDGWIATRDRCEIAGERVRIVGREDKVINVAGSKVYPLEVEQFLLKQPGVAEARVYPVPNPISGFLVGAEVVIDGGEEAALARTRLLAACRAGLAGYQTPRVFRIVDAIETGASGKKG